MRNNKKTIVVIVSCLLLMFALSACGNNSGKEVKRVFKGTIDQTEVTTTYTVKGDMIVRQVTENKFVYSKMGLTDKTQIEAFKAGVIPYSKAFQNIKGVKESLEFKDDCLIEHLDIDFTKADLTELKEKRVLELSGDLSKGVSMKLTEAMVKSQGFEEVK